MKKQYIYIAVAGVLLYILLTREAGAAPRAATSRPEMDHTEPVGGSLSTPFSAPTPIKVPKPTTLQPTSPQGVFTVRRRQSTAQVESIDSGVRQVPITPTERLGFGDLQTSEGYLSRNVLPRY